MAESIRSGAEEEIFAPDPPATKHRRITKSLMVNINNDDAWIMLFKECNIDEL